MAWYRVQRTAAEREVVNAEREAHPQAQVRRKMLVLWLLHCGLTRAKTATVACLERATVQRYVAAYRDGGLDGLRQWDVTGPVSDLVLGAWNAVTRELVAITNTTVVNSETMCDLLRAIAARGLVGPVTLVLDNARYQRNAPGARLGEVGGDRPAVLAVVFAEPEPDRAALAVYETEGGLRAVSPDVRRLPSCH